MQFHPDITSELTFVRHLKNMENIEENDRDLPQVEEKPKQARFQIVPMKCDMMTQSDDFGVATQSTQTSTLDFESLEEEDEEDERGHWGSKAEFILSCIGFSVSL